MESATARLLLTPRALLERSRLSALLRHLGRGGGLTAFGVYLVLALIWDRAALAHLGSACACTTYGDAAQFPWTFVWFPHALFHGLNLLHTPVIWSPGGRNLAGATAPLLPAFAVAPITYLWGPFVAYNLVAILAPVTAAWSAYWLCRHITNAPWASILAGVTYGFGTYETTQLFGDLHLFLIFCPPLAVLCVLRVLEGRSSKRATVTVLSAILLAQMFISPEVLFTLSVVGAGLHVTATVGGVTVYRIPSSWLRSTGTASTSLRETLAAKSVTVSAR